MSDDNFDYFKGRTLKQELRREFIRKILLLIIGTVLTGFLLAIGAYAGFYIVQGGR